MTEVRGHLKVRFKCYNVFHDVNLTFCTIKMSGETTVYSRRKETRKKDEFHCFCCNQTISHRMLNNFVNEIKNSDFVIFFFFFLQFFLLFQNFSHLDLSKRINAKKYLKLRYQKGMGMIGNYISISVIKLDQNE